LFRERANGDQKAKPEINNINATPNLLTGITSKPEIMILGLKTWDKL
jgi:hypothetical protein